MKHITLEEESMQGLEFEYLVSPVSHKNSILSLKLITLHIGVFL